MGRFSIPVLIVSLTMLKKSALIAAVFDTPNGKTVRWAETPDIKFSIPEGATGVSGFYVIWAEGFEQTVTETRFRIFMTTEGSMPVKSVVSFIRALNTYRR